MSGFFVRFFSLILVALTGVILGLYATNRLSPVPRLQLMPAVPPPSPGPIESRISQLLETGGAAASAEAIPLARELLRRDPLSATPLIVAADRYLALDQPEDGRRAILLALQRRPRNETLHAWLAEDAAARGDVDAVVRKLDVLLRLDPTNTQRYVDVLAGVASYPGGEVAIEALLQEARPWSTRLVSALNASSPNVEFLLRINRSSPETQGGLLSRLMSQRGPRATYDAWKALLADSINPGDAAPFDQSFLGLTAPPPFNWRLLGPGVSLEPGGGLYASHDGRGSERLVEQVVLLAPGPYALRVEALTSNRVRGGHLFWTVACLGSREALVRLEMPDTRDEIQTTVAALDIPAEDCEAQILTLSGAPGELALWARSEIANVTVAPRAAVEDAQ